MNQVGNNGSRLQVAGSEFLEEMLPAFSET
jgi:hypothetical protein